MTQIYYPRLRWIILQKYDSFAEFARTLRKSRQYVSTYFETNKPFSVATMDKWARYLHIEQKDYWRYFYREKQD